MVFHSAYSVNVFVFVRRNATDTAEIVGHRAHRFAEFFVETVNAVHSVYFADNDVQNRFRDRIVVVAVDAYAFAFRNTLFRAL